ncbi:MAG TPA: hypothetical protein VJ888_06285 [Mobilitalea sp.]|nr:hypothetical protein [Mobilitalea sp.]
MKHRIKALLQNEYAKLLQEENKIRKPSVSHMAGKVLILFFVTILLFTVISRAAESVTVAQVKLEKLRTDKLFYKLTGMGEIELAEEEYLTVLPNYRIDKVYVSQGEYVSKDTLLYRYNEEDIHTKYNSINTDIEKMKLQINRERLNILSPTYATTESPLLSLSQAEENLRVAITTLSEAESELEESSINTEKELLEDIRKEYEEAEKNYEAVTYSQEKQLKQSLRTLEDARAALVKVYETTGHLEQLIEDYKTAVLSEDSLSIYCAKEAIFQAFYGSEEAYVEHKDAVLSSALAAAWEDINILQLQYFISYYYDLLSTYYDELQSAKDSADPNINSEGNIITLTERYNYAWQSYLENQEEYKYQISLLEKSMTEEANVLKKLRRADIKLEEHLLAFHSSIKESVDDNASIDLYNYILGDNAKTIENDIAAQKLSLTRAEEDYDMLKKENETEKTDLQAGLKELEKVIRSMEDGTYDYEGALEAKKQSVKAARETVRAAEQAVETYQLQYDTAKLSDEDRWGANQKNNQVSELILQGYNFDLQIKEIELEAVKKLMERSGEVTSPYEGIVTSIELEEGKTTSEDELIKIGMGDYLYRAEFDGSKAGYVQVGSEVVVNLPGKETGIKTEISKIIVNGSGRSELTAKLPENDYLLGVQAEFKITAQSERYNRCIPIQALREDNKGKYILVTREQENILGTELIADRISVDVVDKDISTVVVEGALSQKDNVITDSSKYINAGDKVRVK